MALPRYRRTEYHTTASDCVGPACAFVHLGMQTNFLRNALLKLGFALRDFP